MTQFALAPKMGFVQKPPLLRLAGSGATFFLQNRKQAAFGTSAGNLGFAISRRREVASWYKAPYFSLLWRLLREEPNKGKEGRYRLAHLLANLGWVDFDLYCFSLCLVLYGLMGN